MNPEMMKGMMAEHDENNPEMMKNHAKMIHDEKKIRMMKHDAGNDENDGG
jgi:hypothetical protein